MTKTTYEEYLEKNGRLMYKNTGISMLPLIRQGRDVFVVEKKDVPKYNKYDVVLYKRNVNEYVLHRIIGFDDNGYIIRGDNCINKEYGIKHSDVLGVMTSFIRRGKEHSVKSMGYRLYSVIWCRFYFLRLIYQRFFYK